MPYVPLSSQSNQFLTGTNSPAPTGYVPLSAPKAPTLPTSGPFSVAAMGQPVQPTNAGIDLGRLAMAESSGNPNAKAIGSDGKTYQGLHGLGQGAWDDVNTILKKGGQPTYDYSKVNDPAISKQYADVYLNQRVPQILQSQGIPVTEQSKLAFYGGWMKEFQAAKGDITKMPKDAQTYFNNVFGQNKATPAPTSTFTTSPLIASRASQSSAPFTKPTGGTSIAHAATTPAAPAGPGLTPEQIQKIRDSGGQIIGPDTHARANTPIGDTIRNQQNAAEQLGLTPGSRVANPLRFLPGQQDYVVRPATPADSLVTSTIEWPERIARNLQDLNRVVAGKPAIEGAKVKSFINVTDDFYQAARAKGFGDGAATALAVTHGIGNFLVDMGSAADIAAKGVLTATKFNPEVDAALTRLGTSGSNFSAENLARNIQTAARNITTSQDSHAAVQLIKDVDTLSTAMHGEGIFQPKGVFKTIQDVAKTIRAPLGAQAVKPYNLAGNSKEALPGYRPVPGTEPAFPMGLSTQPVEKVGGAYPSGEVKPTDLQPLTTEARKYKSAEEFVKAQPTVYRSGEKGNYFSNSKEYVQQGGWTGKISESSISPNAKILDATNFDSFNKLATKEELGKLAKATQAESNSIRQTILERNGYDGMKFLDEGGQTGKTYETTFLTDNGKSQLQTKSQLTDFYNQATKGVVRPQTFPTTIEKSRQMEADQSAKLSQIQETLANHPAKPLLKYVSQTTGRLPEVTGARTMKSLTGSGKTVQTGQFGRTGDQQITEMGFDDLEKAQEALDNYIHLKKEERVTLQNLQVLRQDLKAKNALSIKASKVKIAKPISQREMAHLEKINKELQLAARENPKLTPEARALPRPAVPEALRLAPAQAVSVSPIESEPVTPASQLQKLDQAHTRIPAGSSFEDIIRNDPTPVQKKITGLDYFRTPNRVLEKIGMGNQAKLLREQYNKYLEELPKNIQKITNWANQVPRASAKNIFRYLDGEKITLDSKELKIAGEIQSWLRDWARRLGLPDDRRISNYITHIFEPDFIKKEFDENLVKIIRNKVPGSVYDPFLEQRLGKLGYVQDVWRALDAYVKRGTRKVFMDKALLEVQRAADTLEDSQYQYILRYTGQINLRPTELDNLVDNTIKNVVGYKFGQRPVTYLLKVGRQMVYRAFLGLNLNSALKNLTQGINTYAKLGEKYTIIGYSKMLWNWNSGELESSGVLAKNFVEDRTLSATRKFWEKIDKGLFVLFDIAERVNRGAAYYGAKSKALAAGKTEQEAITMAKKLVADTQFLYDPVDTPVAFRSDVVKTLLQFGSFFTRQTEFLTELGQHKEYWGLLRYMIGGLAIALTIGKLFGFKPADLIPGYRFGVPPSLVPPFEAAKAVANVPDQYGKVPTTAQKIKNVGSSLLNYVPASLQGQRSIKGAQAALAGGTSTGKQFHDNIPKNTTNLIRAILFGTTSFSGNQTRQQKVRDAYDRAQQFMAQGKTAEAQAIVDSLTDAEYASYKGIKASETTKMHDRVKAVRAQVKSYLSRNDQTSAQSLVDNLTDIEYTYYEQLKAKE